MPQKIVIHSFRPGVGCSGIAANLAYLLATMGRRVGIIDTDTVSPTLHTLLGLPERQITSSFYDYLARTCSFEQAAYPLELPPAPAPGALFLVPGNSRPRHKTLPLDFHTYLELVSQGSAGLINQHRLDAVVIDNQAGLNEKEMALFGLADTLVIVLRYDRRDFQGTSIIMELVRRLEVPQVLLIINEVPASFDFEALKLDLEQQCQCRVGAVLPHVEELMALANRDIFVRRYPAHPLSLSLLQVAGELLL